MHVLFPIKNKGKKIPHSQVPGLEQFLQCPSKTTCMPQSVKELRGHFSLSRHHADL